MRAHPALTCTFAPQEVLRGRTGGREAADWIHTILTGQRKKTLSSKQSMTFPSPSRRALAINRTYFPSWAEYATIGSWAYHFRNQSVEQVSLEPSFS